MRYLLHLLLLPTTALAGVGTVTELEGAASRTPRGGAAPLELQVGAEVEAGDTLEVAAGGNLAVTLTDRSVIALSERSRLTLDEARFGEQGSRAFSARLLLGSLWARVTKAVAGSDSKFEVATERGVAGVRGTVFTVALGSGPAADLEVGVEEGEVEVAHAVEEAASAVALAAGARAREPAPARAAAGAMAELPGSPGAQAVAPVPPRPRFTRSERIAAGSAVTFGERALARHRFQLRHAKMAAFIAKHRARWLKLAADRELKKELRKDLKKLKRELRDLREQRRRR